MLLDQLLRSNVGLDGSLARRQQAGELLLSTRNQWTCQIKPNRMIMRLRALGQLETRDIPPVAMVFKWFKAQKRLTRFGIHGDWQSAYKNLSAPEEDTTGRGRHKDVVIPMSTMISTHML
ncbi:hypothetical protein TIFTF001_019204 [Ficus carica]|uniref:Uncharacterized protein n=1 Tax=Ficus carica TaxID=3494 RepID=A0AA88DBI9_FICCA|nr:hypothetical protein TIFTF001_019204 [Ficus carica]